MRRLRRWARDSTAALTGLLLGICACQRAASDDDSRQSPGPVAPAPHFDTPSTEAQARSFCEAEIARSMALPRSPGTPALDPARVPILARAKAEPVLFVRPPGYTHGANQSIRQIRSKLTSTPYPSEVLKILVKGFRIYPENGRAALLKDGYLYAESPDLAYSLVQYVGAEDLFSDPGIWIQRGEQVFHASRTPAGYYYYTDGPEQGKPAKLILFDRIGTGPIPPALHRDVRSLAYRLSFDRFEAVHVSDDEIVANLHYGDIVVPSVLSSDGARLELRCELVPKARAADLALYRERGARQLRVLQALRAIMVREIDEQLPFDEPIREYGQQDGQLRLAWLQHYRSGDSGFDFQGDRYRVFDSGGRPLVPQVCVDFLTDTFERASGTWYARAGQPPGRIEGKLDFGSAQADWLRQVPAFLELAREKTELFDVWEAPPEARIPFWQKERFYRYLLDNSARFQPGDIVVIRGFAPFERKWEQPKMHYHSFFLYDRDPITGLPLVLVGNAGRPSLRVWDTEARRTPRRSIWYRIRPRLHWLESVVDSKLGADDTPAPLSVGPD